MAPTSEAFLIDNVCEIHGVGAVLRTPPGSFFGGRGYFVMEAPELASPHVSVYVMGPPEIPPECSPHMHTSSASKSQNSTLTMQKQEVLRILSEFPPQWHWGVTTLNLRSLRLELLSWRRPRGSGERPRSPKCRD